MAAYSPLLRNRSRSLRHGLVGLIVLFTMAGLTVRASAADGIFRFYWKTDLGTLPGYTTSTAVAINESAQVLCQAVKTGLPARAFLWSAGDRLDLGSSSGGDTWAYALDDAGRAAGADTPASGAPQPFLWEAGQFQLLTVPAGYVGGEARALAGDGTAAGDLIDPQGGHHACVWRNDTVTLLPELPGRPFSHVRGMNSAGQVVGATFAVYDPPGVRHAGQGRAALWSQGGVVDLGVARGYSASEARAINDGGEVVGVSLEPPGFQQAFRWKQGVFTPTGPQNSEALAINNAGWMVGSALDYIGRGNSLQMAWWWNDQNGGAPFTDRFTGGSYSYYLDLATGINEAGQVIGIDGGAFLLTPACAEGSVTFTSSTPTPAVGEPFALTLVIRNLGPDPGYRLSTNVFVPDALQLVSGSTSHGELHVLEGFAYLSFDPLPAGATVTVTLTAVARAAGALAAEARVFIANQTGLGPLTAAVTVQAPGEPLPDLEPDWSYVAVRKLPGRPRSEWTVGGYLRILNRGTASAAPTTVRCYLVDSNAPGARRYLLRTYRIPAMEAEGVEVLQFRAPIPLAMQRLRGQILAVVDEPGLIRESNEANNSQLSNSLVEKKP